MKVITEMVLRNELKGECPPVYYVPKDKLLSPAAKEYLNQLKIKVEFGEPPAAPAPAASNNKGSAISDTPAGAKYVDELTGAFYVKKPEYMCQLFGNRLVYKNHPRIAFRGKLDSMSSTVVQVQAEIAATNGPQKLIDDLSAQMAAAARALKFELAGRLRDEVFELRKELKGMKEVGMQ